jgi:hypothetical protein
MSEIKVNKISPKQTCTQLTLGDSGDTIIIPAGATITNNGTATGFGRTGTVNWDTTKKTIGFTAVSGVGYFCDTNSAAFTATLPATPTAGDIVAFSDYTGTWSTNNLTVGRNGSNINAATENLILNGSNTTATFIYVDGTEGWRIIDTGSLSEVSVPLYISATGGTITTCGNYKIHTFTGPGTFTVSSAGNSLGSNSVDYLVVAGGGGGGNGQPTQGGGGGGGAGGYRQNYPSPAIAGLPVTATAYPITVGSGGANGAGGTPGNNSVFSTITSAGGGGGATRPSPSPVTASSGGSGGGGASSGPGGPGAGGSGNTPPVSPSQGSNGGTGTAAAPSFGGGGGGGSSAVGNDGNGSGGGAGGAGTAISISGSPVTYGGGGGGGVYNGPGSNVPTVGAGGSGGGGNGQPNPVSGNGGTNTGGGGGGGSSCVPSTAGGSGGSGIVVIRYKYQ